ncbi:MAG: tRNA (guanosine(46)-N7)-methyltransferase TrmB [Terrimonas sp.]|nr:tRNA (guanosine(46)-N7)-methyltransferase TrmB [Terrimonas sp.]
MGHKKRIRFEAIRSFPNVLQYPLGMQGAWNNFFKNDHPITLELACGKGEYTIGLSQLYPDQNFIGVDLKGNRIYIGAKKALDQHLNNAAFLRTEIDKINSYFAPKEVAAIWITFPDPQLRVSKAKKRLTHPKFLRLYQQILQTGGYIHLKTDSPVLYRFTKKVIQQYNCILLCDYEDSYSQDNIPETLKIKTYYESLDIANSKKIHYLKFSLPAVIPGASEDKLLQEFLKDYEADRT